jgi:hypothetical protein
MLAPSTFVSAVSSTLSIGRSSGTSPPAKCVKVGKKSNWLFMI